MSESKRTIAKNVAALRKHKKWSQQQLANKAGISQRTISNIESPQSGDYSATTDKLDRIAEAFGIETYLLYLPVPIDVLLNKAIDRTITCYAEASAEGRENIARIAENEMRYSSAQRPDHNQKAG